MEKQPSIEILGIIFNEPVTALTDVMIAMVCIYAYVKLRKLNSTKKEIKYLKYFFLSMAFATAFGGIIGHGLLHYLSWGWKLPAWLTSMVSVAFLERASIYHTRNYIKPSVGKFFAVLNVVELVTFVIITFTLLEFRWVEFHSAYGILLIVGGFSAYLYLRIQSQASKWFLYGVALSVLSAVVFTQGWGFHKWFNHMDVSHILMCFGAWTFYQGGLRMI